jgi:uncharacterized protein involved in exopolysaccharide biosynthesis
MKQQLDAETRRIGESVTTTSRISRGKETELRAAIEEQKQKILQLNAQRDQVLVLQQEADNAQKAYDAVAQRQMQSEMQSKMVQTNVSVLTPAAEPIDPSFPRIGLNLLLAVFLGGMLGIGVALAKETMNRRIRSGDDVTTILELPVLALVEKPQAKSVKWWQRIPDLLRARRPARLPA